MGQPNGLERSSRSPPLTSPTAPRSTLNIPLPRNFYALCPYLLLEKPGLRSCQPVRARTFLPCPDANLITLRLRTSSTEVVFIGV